MKQKIEIKNMDMFIDVAKAAAKIVESAKFILSPAGVEIYGAHAKAARCEIASNSLVSDENLNFSIERLQNFIKILTTVKEIHDGDYSGLKMSYDQPFIRFESKKFKTKLSTCDENTISQWISKKIETEMTPVFEFTSNSDFIKRINGHSFMFSDPKSVRVYLETKDDMENNSVFATMGNRESNLNNEITFKFGLVNSGSLLMKDDNGLVVGERSIILDLERLNLFNAIQSDHIKFQLMNLNCLASKTQLQGKDGSFFNLNIYSTMLKN